MRRSLPVPRSGAAPVRRRRSGPHPLVLALVWALALLWLVPLVGALITSLRTMDDLTANGLWSLPRSLTLDNFARAWTNAGVARSLGNSFLITLPALSLTLLLGSMCAYALVRFRFALSRPLYLLFVGGMMLPFQMLLLPVFQLSNALHLYNSLWSLILVHAAFQLAFCAFVLRNFLRTVPASLFESAQIDGAGDWTMFFRIALPMLVPGLAALATLNFTWIFNDYLWALVLIQDSALKPITTGLSNLRGQFNTDYPLIVAGSLIAMLPTLIVFFGLQRYFIRGLTMGAVKG